MKKLAYLLTILAFILQVTFSYAQKKGVHHTRAKAFSSADYEPDKWLVKIQNVTLGEIEIRMIHAQSRGLEEEPQCKAWLEVRKGTKVTGSLFYDDIAPDSGVAGIFAPQKQPREDLFIAYKFGDYDGRLLVVDRTGRITDLVGGQFYTNEDNDLLFANYASDQNGVTVYDLAKNDWLLSDSAKIKYKLGQWYYKDDEYFAIAENPNPEDTTKITIGTFDMKKKKIIYTEVEKSYPSKDAMLKINSFYTSGTNKGNCSCGKR